MFGKKKEPKKLIRKITKGDAWIQVGSLGTKKHPEFGVVDSIRFRDDIYIQSDYKARVYEVRLIRGDGHGGTELVHWKDMQGDWDVEYDVA